MYAPPAAAWADLARTACLPLPACTWHPGCGREEMEGALEQVGLDMWSYQRDKQVKAFIQVGEGRSGLGVVCPGSKMPLLPAVREDKVARVAHRSNASSQCEWPTSVLLPLLICLHACLPAAWGGPGLCHRRQVQVCAGCYIGRGGARAPTG